MQTTANTQKSNGSLGITTPLMPPKQPIVRTWAEFEKKYLGREDGYKYEWVNGCVEKTENTMNPTQLYIQFNLQECFMHLKSDAKVVGQLLAETDLLFFPNIHRRPDFAWLTQTQVSRLSTAGVLEIPAFVIEVISTRDAALKLVDKMRDYRTAGVQVVWLIYPQQQEIHVYGGTNLEQMTVCTGEKLCSAAPVLPEFVFPTSTIFKKDTNSAS